MKHQLIISQFQESLSKGLAALFENYGQQLYGYAVKQWHLDEDEGYDLLYKTLETVGNVITRYEFVSESHFSNWLFKIHKNNILQFVRAKKAKEAELYPVNYANWEEEATELEDGIKLDQFKPVIEKLSTLNPFGSTPSHGQLMLAMQKALLQVSETERELLLLRMNNYSYDEIAAMLGIENNQLKVKFNRAKAKILKKTLEILNDIYNETR